MNYQDLSREELLSLLEDFAKRWLAHDGLWFQAVEQAFGMEQAMEMDKQAWEKFTVIEARRAMNFLGIESGGGLEALEKALNIRLYRLVNRQTIIREGENRLILKMINCRVQEARRRKDLSPFPCKPVGEVEYSGFARTVDPRIETRCLGCPPDELSGDYWCAWEFSL